MVLDMLLGLRCLKAWISRHDVGYLTTWHTVPMSSYYASIGITCIRLLQYPGSASRKICMLRLRACPHAILGPF
jgi:hypothetical protein